MTQLPSALQGVKVLDLSRVLAGPWSTQLLADLGAEVIKVERPVVGDDTRHWGPPFMTSGDAAYFHATNRNKKSIEVDFTKPEGAAVLRQIAATSDIVVENFKVGGLAKYNLDYASLAEVNPKLVYCSITGFGQTGPKAAKPGYDFLIQAMGGLMSVTGQPDTQDGAEPVRAGVAVADLFAGMYATTGILAALYHAKQTGQGQYIDLALFDCQVAMLANQASNYLTSGEVPGRIGNTHPNIVPYQVFATQDSHMVVAVGNDNQYKSYCEAIKAPVLAQDEAYQTNAQRVKNRVALVAALRPIMKTRTTGDWLTRFEVVNVPCGPINSIDQVFLDPQITARDTLVSFEGSTSKYVANPLKLSATPVQHTTAPPELGSETKNILLKAGFSETDITTLAGSGAVKI